MKDGIYISPAAVRFGMLGLLVLLIFILTHQAPDIRRYIKFESM
jgi:hypothetical protein